jgi:Global regulator protein family
MLVLSRKPGERLVLPHLGVAVTVLAVEGKAVRLAWIPTATFRPNNSGLAGRRPVPVFPLAAATQL